MRVAADIDIVELEGDYCPVEGVCATCTRCGAETESFGTSDASVRRCFVLLRDECPRNEHNYYFDAGEQQRESPEARAYERGYADGQAAVRERPASARPQLDAEQLRELVQLTHPDRHPPDRFEQANRATAQLLDLLQRPERTSRWTPR